MKQRVFLILFITLFTAVLFLLTNRYNERSRLLPQGFNRKTVQQHAVKYVRKIRIEKPLFIAGCYEKNIYFYTGDPETLVVMDTTFNEVRTRQIPVHSALLEYLPHGFAGHYEHPFYYLYAYNIAAILRYDLTSNEQVIVPVPGNYTNCIPVGNSSFLVKCYEAASINQQLYKLSLYSGNGGPQHDSIINGPNSSGRWMYDPASAHSVYVHHYHNQVVVTDTNLRVVNTFHTIDTFSHLQQVYVSERINSTGDSVYGRRGSSRITNYQGRLYKGRLYIYSLVRADNDAGTGHVIDIYDPENGEYEESLYIPGNQGGNITDFDLYNNLLIVCYPSSVLIYELLP